MKRNLSLAALILFFVTNLFAQAPNIQIGFPAD